MPPLDLGDWEKRAQNWRRREKAALAALAVADPFDGPAAGRAELEQLGPESIVAAALRAVVKANYVGPAIDDLEAAAARWDGKPQQDRFLAAIELLEQIEIEEDSVA
jgi:hypothetical protein